MAELVVEELLQSSHRMEDQTVGLLLGADGKRYDLRLPLKVAPLIGAAILREAGSIQTNLPEGGNQEAQFLGATAIQPSILSDGNVGLVLTLAGGAELVISLPPAAFAQIADMFVELAQASKPRN